MSESLCQGRNHCPLPYDSLCVCSRKSIFIDWKNNYLLCLDRSNMSPFDNSSSPTTWHTFKITLSTLFMSSLNGNFVQLNYSDCETLSLNSHILNNSDEFL